jgi:hypothetical protein
MEVNTIILKAEGILKQIVTPVTVCQSVLYSNRKGLVSTPIDVRAMWDTGADCCCISSSLAYELGLTSIGAWNVRGFQSSGDADAYILDMTLPDGQIICNVPVITFEGSGNYDIIIGMNIISLGRFLIDNNNGNTIFSFKLANDKTETVL